MKGYGLPRNHDIDWPDCADMREYGRKSSVGRFAKKGGEYAGPTGDKKSRYRRVWKRLARIESLLSTPR